MSEKLSSPGRYEQIDLSVETQHIEKHINEAAEAAPSAEKIANMHEQASAQAAEHAVSGAELTIGESESSPAGQQHFGQYKQLKAKAYEQSLKRIRGHLNKPEKALSKVVHQPAVDTVSNGLAKTVARPSGIYGAGLIGIIGSVILIYLTKHYGFSYNFTVFLILLVLGYVGGLALEFALRFTAKLRR